MNIKELVDRIVKDGKITVREHKELLDAISENGVIDEEENEQINRVINMINNGEVEVV